MRQWSGIGAAALALGLLAGAQPAAAQTVVFDFEEQAPTWSFDRTGALTSLTMSKEGLTATLTRAGIGFDIVNNTINGQTGKPASYGARSLDPFWNSENNTPFLISFSAPVSSFAITAGDYGGDAEELQLQFFSGENGTGELLAAPSTFVGDAHFPPSGTLSASAPGIRSVKFIAGSPDYPNSAFYDNITVSTAAASAVPEPASALLFLPALGVVALVRRRRSA